MRDWLPGRRAAVCELEGEKENIKYTHHVLAISFNSLRPFLNSTLNISTPRKSILRRAHLQILKFDFGMICLLSKMLSYTLPI